MFLPLFFSVGPKTDVDATEYDYIPDDPSLLEQLGKQTPLEHSDIAHFFPLMLALELLLLSV